MPREGHDEIHHRQFILPPDLRDDLAFTLDSFN
jgi:hypothetical protein